MKAHLLYPDKDWDWQWVRSSALLREAPRPGRYSAPDGFDPEKGLPWNHREMSSDLGLGVLFETMADGDEWIHESSRKAILSASTTTIEAVQYRQQILKDCLENAATAKAIYDLACHAMERPKGNYFSLVGRSPDSILHRAIEEMTILIEFLRRLRSIADDESIGFVSQGWKQLFAALQQDLDDEYLSSVQGHLKALRLHNGTLIGACMGRANKGQEYVLHRTPYHRWNLLAWLDELFESHAPGFSFELSPRDEAGARALAELQNRGVALAANALAQSVDHVRDFFITLRTELGFYMGCGNLIRTLRSRGASVCFPTAFGAQLRRLSAQGLYDVCLLLSSADAVQGNDPKADDADMIIVSGRNTGGKSTFLRSVGTAQLMLQAGMIVPAERYEDSLCDGVYTHFKREEDTRMESGKFDEELGRMSGIVDHIRPNALLLSNESFASTNEREGSEVGRQVFLALLDEKVRIVAVTHMYELSSGFYKNSPYRIYFLRAEREGDGARSFRLAEGEPLPTSFGQDLYYRFFTNEARTGCHD